VLRQFVGRVSTVCPPHDRVADACPLDELIDPAGELAHRVPPLDAVADAQFVLTRCHSFAITGEFSGSFCPFPSPSLGRPISRESRETPDRSVVTPGGYSESWNASLVFSVEGVALAA
jgi:hypothetical protein